MDTIIVIILTAVISSFVTFLFAEFVSWKVSARSEKIDEKKKLLEELYSPLITILNWMTVRTENQLESDALSDTITVKDNEICYFVLHPHQYDKLWNIRSKYRYLFADDENIKLNKLDEIFLNLKLFKNNSGRKERWVYETGLKNNSIKQKNELISSIDCKIIEISKEINRLEKVTNNVFRRILFFLTFWKV